MNFINIPTETKTKNFKNALANLKSDYFLIKIFEYMKKSKSLEIIKYNKELQKRLNLSINNYNEYSEFYSSIELELKLVDEPDNIFLNVHEKDLVNYQIYFDNSKEEINRYFLYDNEKVKKINIRINHKVVSFHRLFYNCKCISSITFKRFNRTNITNMCEMFRYCFSLEELNLNNFNTNNVNDMSYMFYGCFALKEINLTTFNTANVKNMSYMFYNCESLKKLNLTNFNTKNVIDMNHMFNGCSLLNELNLSNFNTKNVRNMSHMFNQCESLLDKY